MTAILDIHQVDPARLAHGTWCSKRNRQIGEGDIAAAYSADRIACGEPIRMPFEWNGAMWVTVAQFMHEGAPCAKAYRLVAPDQFAGAVKLYAHRIRECESARIDPAGFHHGVIVTHRGETCVLCGPPVCLVAGEKQQFDLFDGG